MFFLISIFCLNLEKMFEQKWWKINVRIFENMMKIRLQTRWAKSLKMCTASRREWKNQCFGRSQSHEKSKKNLNKKYVFLRFLTDFGAAETLIFSFSPRRRAHFYNFLLPRLQSCFHRFGERFFVYFVPNQNSIKIF